MRTSIAAIAVTLATALAVAPLSGTPTRRAAAATVREYERVFPTYPFSDPNPIPTLGRIYPYYRFDGFTDRVEQRAWKVVELENDYIKVMILPQIGGKIWNAVDKRTNRSFIYFNQVVKFRDIAMRGPWTSGGIEANYGIIGHTPNVATPVDYVTRTNADGSVSCIIGALDLLTRTPWRLEIRLGREDASFSTSSFWYNASPLEQPYYSWMNAGIKVKGKLQFVYPGTSRLGHAGEHGPWPLDGGGRDLSWYDNNNFGGYKSYHVFGQATDYFGAYWHDDDFGMVRYGPRDEKAGKKIWIWGLSRQGMIWEQLLTDNDGQYAEVQSGRLFNQSAEQSTFTPFKHRGFAPHTADRWTEHWYPVVGTRGVAAAGRVGAMNVTISGDRLIVALSPVLAVADTLVVYDGARRLGARFVSRAPLELRVDTFAIAGVQRDSLRIVLGDDLLMWHANTKDETLSRPLDAPGAFDWTSAYGRYTRGKEWMRQREYDSARVYLDSALARDRYFVPALADRAMLAIRAMQYAAAVDYARTALSVDTYDGAANYYYGLANRRLGRLADAKDGFEIAAQSPEFRGAAWTELARLSLAGHLDAAAAHFAAKALSVDAGNLDALGAAIVAARRRGQRDSAAAYTARLESADPLSHQARAERLLASNDPAFGAKLAAGIRMEDPEQVMFELAAWYADAGDGDVVRRVLEAIGEHPMALYLRAFMLRNAPAATSRVDSLIARADAMSPSMVFPFRSELEPVLRFVNGKTGHWKSTYYLALLRASAVGNASAANALLATLRDVPDYAPFYALRASTIPGDASTWPSEVRALVEHDLRRAIALDSMQWRYGKLLAEFHLKTANPTAAVTVARRYATRFPSNYILGATLARSYVAAGQYREADRLLSTLTILPHEGARDGHVLYRQAKLALAEEAIAARQWNTARTHIAAARLWPERLGAGKPYDADLDERMEDSLLAVVNARSRASSAGRDDDTVVKLTFDWKALGLDSARTRIRAPAISVFQEAGRWAPGAPLTVPGKKGRLLVLEPSGTP